MGALFGGGAKTPAPQAPVTPAPAPVRDDAAVQGAASAERQRVAALLGRGATMQASGPGAYRAAPDRRPVLLGAG
jgi:hypothetical protein